MSRSSERGSIILEFAFSSTIFMMMLFGALSGAISVYRYSMIANLAQEGARWGIVRGSTATSARYAEGTSAQMLSYLQVRNPSVPITISLSADPNTLSPGDTLAVTIASTWLPITSYTAWSAFTISATSKMQMAR